MYAIYIMYYTSSILAGGAVNLLLAAKKHSTFIYVARDRVFHTHTPYQHQTKGVEDTRLTGLDLASHFSTRKCRTSLT